MSQDTAAFFAGNIPAIKFEKQGDSAEGDVLRVEIRQQSDFDTGRLLTWPDGRPKNQAVVTLQTVTPPDDEDDDGVRNLYVRGYMQRAITGALKAARLRDLTEGCYLKVTWSGTDKPKRQGTDGAKLYEAVIAPPARTAS